MRQSQLVGLQAGRSVAALMIVLYHTSLMLVKYTGLLVGDGFSQAFGRERCVDATKFGEINTTVRDFQPTVIYHFAARTDLHRASFDEYPASTIGAENLIRAILGSPSKPRRTVFASSCLVCKIGYMPCDEFDNCPTTPYGASKVRFEKIVRKMAAEEFDWVMVRPTSIWGPWFEAPYRFFSMPLSAGTTCIPREEPCANRSALSGTRSISLTASDTVTTRASGIALFTFATTIRSTCSLGRS
jgi:NAD dependent epimerase/dehydratase family